MPPRSLESRVATVIATSNRLMEPKRASPMAYLQASAWWSRFYHKTAFPAESGTCALNSYQYVNNRNGALGS
jgi:hypothetical protein